MSGAVAVRQKQASMVIQRLERLLADSAWAHISSGYRGALLRVIERLEREPDLEQTPIEVVQHLDFLIDKGFELLSNAAREMGDPDLIRGLRPAGDLPTDQQT